MSAPWTSVKAYGIHGQTPTIVELDVPHRGTITDLCLQLSENVDGTFWLYAAEAAATTGALQLLGSEAAVEEGQPQYQASRILAVEFAAGTYRGPTRDVVYCNTDGTSTNPVAKLWLVVQTESGDDMQLTLSITIKGADFR